MKKSITLTAGHSNTDPGAVNKQRTEADIAVDMRNMVRYYLIREGWTVKTDGEGKINFPLIQAIKLAIQSPLAIEFHCNAGPSTAKGCEVLAQLKHKELAQTIAQAIAKEMSIPLRGDKGYKPENSGQHSRLGFISKGNGLIVELFFISNNDELATWDRVKWRVAKEVADAINNYANNH